MYLRNKERAQQFHWQIRRRMFVCCVGRFLLFILFIASLLFFLTHLSGCATHRPDSVTFRGCKVTEPAPLVGCECNSIVWMVDAKDKHHKIALCAR